MLLQIKASIPAKPIPEEAAIPLDRVRIREKPSFASPFQVTTNSGGPGPKDAKLAAAATSAALITSESLYDTLSFACEGPRLEALKSFALLDTGAEGRFDALTELAATFFDVPVAVVSLVDASRGWFKSNYGPFQGCVGREGSFCSYIMVPDFAEILIVEDCTKDARFSHNPYVVGPPELRYYAGCPLVTSMGHRIGTLCLCDFKPRRFPASAYNVMCNLAEIIVREVERDIVQQTISSSDMDGISDTSTISADFSELGINGGNYCTRVPRLPAAREPVVMVDVTTPAWPIIFANEAWAEILDSNVDFVKNRSFWEFFKPAGDFFSLDKVQSQVAAGIPASVLTNFVGEEENEGREVIRTQFWVASRDQLKNAVPVGIPGFVEVNEEAAEPVKGPLSALWIGTAQVINGEVDSAGSIGSARSTGSTHSVGSTYSVRSNVSAVYPTKPQRMAKIQMGPLLGQGSFGKVYRGMIGDKTVAVKVLDVPISFDVNNSMGRSGNSSAGTNSGGSNMETTAEKALLEAAVSRHLAHPNIVPTLDYFVNPKVSYSLYAGLMTGFRACRSF